VGDDRPWRCYLPRETESMLRKRYRVPLVLAKSLDVERRATCASRDELWANVKRTMSMR
jgi:hypothetical protein